MRLTFLFIFFSIFGFSQTETYQFPKIPSSVSIPVNLPISEIQRLVNQQITGVLYEDQDFENNNNYQLKTKVEKDGNIAIKALTNNRLMFSVPLKIWAEKGLGTLGTVSYTHLDVYKRQIPLKIIPKNIINFFIKSFYQR